MSSIKLFESKKIRSQWDAEKETWYFSIVDVVGVLTDSPDARNYWKVLKHRLAKEGNESVTNCNQLKLQSSDGNFSCRAFKKDTSGWSLPKDNFFNLSRKYIVGFFAPYYLILTGSS